MYQLIAAPGSTELHEQNTGEVLDALVAEGIISGELHEELARTLAFFRSILSRVRLITGRAADVYSPGASYAEAVAKRMGFGNPQELSARIEERIEAVVAIFAHEIGRSA